MVRPPPLQLQVDNWRSPDIVAVLNVFRYLNCTRNAFIDFEVDKSFNVSELAILSFVTGIIAITLAIVELFGVVANIVPRRLHLIEAYTRLVYVSAVLIAISGLIQSSSYIVYKRELLGECQQIPSHGGPLRSTFLNWSPIIGTTKTASQSCSSSYEASTLPVILSFPFAYLLPMIIQLVIVHTYYNQNSRSAGPAVVYHKIPPASPPVRGNGHAYAKGGKPSREDEEGERGWLSFTTTRTPFFTRFHSFLTRSSRYQFHLIKHSHTHRYQSLPNREPQHNHRNNHIRSNTKNDTRGPCNNPTNGMNGRNKNTGSLPVAMSRYINPSGRSVPVLPSKLHLQSGVGGGGSPGTLSLMTPGPPSYGDGVGPGGFNGRQQESLYGKYGGRLSAFTIGSVGSTDEFSGL
ncbi:hypothetical protein ONZ45_g14168 [Pleurotus djamor]|nr:hypothetical protein ONZ45_g14168 [Pleurotus djamor]